MTPKIRTGNTYHELADFAEAIVGNFRDVAPLNDLTYIASSRDGTDVSGYTSVGEIVPNDATLRVLDSYGIEPIVFSDFAPVSHGRGAEGLEGQRDYATDSLESLAFYLNNGENGNVVEANVSEDQPRITIARRS